MSTQVAVTGSVAFDTIMVFPGRFGEHILPDKTHLINVSFLVDRLEKRRGGTAANVAYTLALHGESPLLCAAVGSDFDAYDDALRNAGVDTSTVLRCDDIPTASAFITTDLDDNQITAFFPGAMGRGGDVSLLPYASRVDTVVVAPDAPDGMALHIAQAREMGARLVFVPAQQIPSLPEETLRAGLESAWMVVGNDYELELIRSRTGLSADDLRRRGALVALTRGDEGSELHGPDGVVRIPAARPREVVDPTGAGDAYVAGLLAGLRRGLPLEDAGRMAALSATYVVEQQGTQEHSFDTASFAERLAGAF
ncbi:MAG TPA: carbohydrate kinase family protein [Candidatus Dormibacteraeota bacterium]|nr:carbohydrate kinase family protein [Candidatus Dormibacteraeota bacterium]